jgi:thiosulfate/3-mercaptopyruvate sulfurtransferase
MKPGIEVDPDWVAGHLDDPAVRLVEVDVGAAAYDERHIPGAVLWDAYQDLRHPDYVPIDPDELDAVLSRSGITAETTVVFYGYAPYLGFWLMDYHGHERIRVMEGPRERWGDAGYPWSAEVPTPSPSSYERLGERPGLVVGRQEVEEMIADRETVLIDVRSREEFTGERFWPSGATEGAGRPGHIPGALHIPVDLAREEDGSLADGEDLRRALEERGVEPGQRVVVYCTIGNRASQVGFALRQMLGYTDVAVYYGSWSEWGSSAETPVETSSAA